MTSPTQSILLLFFLDSPKVLDPIRIMKGIFIFTMESPLAWLPQESRYQFVPYSYGPYSRQIDADLNRLKLQGLLTSSQAAGRNWDYYSLTEQGTATALELKRTLDPKALAYLHRVREFVLSLSFRKLLDSVYERYPAYAVKSVFKR
jgi:hypothetical protein